MFCEGMNNAKLGEHDQSYLFFLPQGQLGVQLLKTNAWNQTCSTPSNDLIGWSEGRTSSDSHEKMTTREILEQCCDQGENENES